MQENFLCFPGKGILTKNIEEDKVQQRDYSGFAVWQNDYERIIA